MSAHSRRCGYSASRTTIRPKLALQTRLAHGEDRVRRDGACEVASAPETDPAQLPVPHLEHFEPKERAADTECCPAS